MLIINMKQTTRKIIDRALALTDFNDSVFISNEELTNLLNDCYQECYDLLVSNGDKSFLKQTTVTNGSSLPKDFYKLLELKRKKEYLQKTEDYDIVNNKVILYNNLNSADFYYYPMPKVLSLKSNIKEDLGYDNVITLWQDGYVQPNKLIDENGNTIVELSNLSNTTYLRNGYINQESDAYVIRDYASNAYSDIKLIKGNQITYDKVNLTTTVENPIAVITNDSESFYYILDNKGVLYNKSGDIALQSFSPSTLYCKEDGLYYVSSNRLYKILGTTVENFPNAYTVYGILDAEYISCKLGTLIKKMGYGIDSILDIPYSTFWTYFAYSIAVSMCNVVQRDSTAIQSKLESARNQFLTSLNYDNNSAYTIRNVEGYSLIW